MKQVAHVDDAGNIADHALDRVDVLAVDGFTVHGYDSLDSPRSSGPPFGGRESAKIPLLKRSTRVLSSAGDLGLLRDDPENGSVGPFGSVIAGSGPFCG
jgi:hypothetical protein